MKAIEILAASRFLPVIRLGDPESALRTAQAAAGAGVGAVEITLDTPGALDVISRLASDGITVGAGTVMRAEDVGPAAEAGASFVVSPLRPDGFVAAARAAGVEAIPAALTPSELGAALAEGPDAVKLFPAGPVGTQFLRQLRAIWPDAQILPSGGIGAEAAEIASWLEAGALAVAIGGSLGAARDQASAGAYAERVSRLLEEVEGRRRE